MSYAPPASPNVDFLFDGSAYAPTPGTANFSWGQGFATGFVVTGFGAPTLRLTQFAEGFVTGGVGAPGTVPQFEDASGWLATTFGQAGVVHNTVGAPVTALGTPSSLLFATRDANLVDLATGAPILGGFADALQHSYTDPLSAFEGWAAELGVSSSTLPGNISGTDSANLVDMGFPVLRNNEAENRLLLSSGHFGLYREPPTDATLTEPSGGAPPGMGAPEGQQLLTGPTTVSRPSLGLMVRYSAAATEAVETRWRSYGETLLAYGRFGRRSSPSLDVVELALRMRPGRIEAVARPISGSGTPYFIVRQGDQVDQENTGVAPSGRSTALTAGQTSVFVAEGEVPTWAFAQGEILPKCGTPTVPGAVGYVKELTTATQALGAIGELGTPQHRSAANAYTAWAAQMGVSPTASLPGAPAGVPGALTQQLIDLGFAPVQGGTETRILFGYQALALYRDPIANASMGTGIPIDRPDPQQGVVNWDGTESSPSLLVVPNADPNSHYATNAKWQKAGSQAILYGEYQRYSGALLVEFAARLQPGSIEVVLSHVSMAGNPVVTFEVIPMTQQATRAGYLLPGGPYTVANTGGFSRFLNTDQGVISDKKVYQFLSKIDQLAVQAAGFTSVQFGTASAGAQNRQVQVTSLGEVTRFAPASVRLKTRATGAQHTQLGTPRLTSFGLAAGATVTAFGTPALQPGATGFEHARVGQPFAFRGFPNTDHRVTFAVGGSETAYGQPVASTTVAVPQTGAQHGAFGLPAARLALFAQGWATGALGTPLARAQARAVGWIAAGVGVPYLNAGQQAVGARFWHPGSPALLRSGNIASGWSATRHGTPVLRPAGPYAVRGWAVCRLGQPTAERERLGQRASGWLAGGLGVHRAHWGLHASHLPPTAQFGEPTITRSILC